MASPRLGRHSDPHPTNVSHRFYVANPCGRHGAAQMDKS